MVQSIRKKNISKSYSDSFFLLFNIAILNCFSVYDDLENDITFLMAHMVGGLGKDNHMPY